MMTAIYEPFLPPNTRWSDLFDVTIVSACKPEFFSPSRRPVYALPLSRPRRHRAPAVALMASCRRRLRRLKAERSRVLARSYEIATSDGYLREASKFQQGGIYAGGTASLLERCLKFSGPQARARHASRCAVQTISPARALRNRAAMALQSLAIDSVGAISVGARP